MSVEECSYLLRQCAISLIPYSLKSTAGEDARSCLQNLATLSEQTAREFAKLRQSVCNPIHSESDSRRVASQLTAQRLVHPEHQLGHDAIDFVWGVYGMYRDCCAQWYHFRRSRCHQPPAG